MARNGSGTYSVVNSFTPSATISSSAVNANFTDIGNEITNSLALDGQSSMTGVLKIANGSAAAPGIAFASDTNTGFYRIGADSIGVSIGGVLLATFDSSGITLASGDVLGTGIIKTAALEDDAVTYAKLQNVSATSRILGRKTAAAGDAEECTLSEILDFIGSAAQGDILYRGAAGWARLGAGTSGQFLKTQGAGANPAWDTITTLPTQSGNSGRLLTTDGSSASWSGDSATRCRGYVTVSGTTPTLQAGSVNVASVTRIAGPLYRVTFTNALASALYTAIVTGQSASGYPAAAAVVNKTTTYFDCQFTVHTVASFLDPVSFDFIVQGGF